MMSVKTLHASQLSTLVILYAAAVCIWLCCSAWFIDADFDLPLKLAGPGGSAALQFVPDEGSVSMIESMGFTRRQATAALKATVITSVFAVQQQLEIHLWLSTVNGIALQWFFSNRFVHHCSFPCRILENITVHNRTCRLVKKSMIYFMYNTAILWYFCSNE